MTFADVMKARVMKLASMAVLSTGEAFASECIVLAVDQISFILRGEPLEESWKAIRDSIVTEVPNDTEPAGSVNPTMKVGP